LISGFALRLGTDPLEGVALVGVENLTGTGRNDELEGSNGANKLVGGAGAAPSTSGLAVTTGSTPATA
jgi:hypothetical protein